MKSLCYSIAGTIVILILAAVVTGIIFWSRVPDIIATRLSEKMKVPVQIDSIGLGLSKITIKNFQIGNPRGSILSKAFTCAEIDILAPITHYMQSQIVIDEIDLKNVYLGLEFDSASGTSGNWTWIMSNLKQSMGTTTQAPTKKSSSKRRKNNTAMETPATTPSSDRSLLIKKIVLTNIDVDVVYRKEGGKIKRLPRIPRMELTNISSEGGFPMDQITNSVLGEMLKEIFIQENLKNMLQDLINVPNNFKQYLSPFKGFFNCLPENQLD